MAKFRLATAERGRIIGVEESNSMNDNAQLRDEIDKEVGTAARQALKKIDKKAGAAALTALKEEIDRKAAAAALLALAVAKAKLIGEPNLSNIKGAIDGFKAPDEVKQCAKAYLDQFWPIDPA